MIEQIKKNFEREDVNTFTDSLNALDEVEDLVNQKKEALCQYVI